MKTMVNITLEKIIQRKILYCQNDNNQELANMNAGYVRGFNQMLEDIKSNIPENHKNEKIIIDGQTYHQALKIYAQEILSILKGEKENN